MRQRYNRKHRIFAVTWVAYAGFYLCRKNLGIVLPLLHNAAGLSNLQLANIIFGYSLLYAIGQFTCGPLSDCFGPKRVVGAGLIIIVASNLFMPVHPAALWLLVFACLNGAGQSTGWSGLVKIMASWFDSAQRGVVMAWWTTNYVLGGFLASAFATWAVTEHFLFAGMGWKRGFVFPALVLSLVTVGFFLLVQSEPEESQQSSADNPVTSSQVRTKLADVLHLFGSGPIWSMGVSYFFLEMCRYALLFWLPFYMVTRLHFSVAHSGYVSSLYELAGVGGALFAGYVSDRMMQSRRAPISAVMLFGFAVVILLLTQLARFGIAGMVAAVSLAGIMSYGPDTLLSGAGAQDIGQARTAATASGLIDGIGHLGTLISPYLVVFVSRYYGWDKLFLVFAAAGVVSAIVLFPIWNLRPHDAPDAGNFGEEQAALVARKEVR